MTETFRDFGNVIFYYMCVRCRRPANRLYGTYGLQGQKRQDASRAVGAARLPFFFFDFPLTGLVESEYGRMDGAVFCLDPFGYVGRQLPDRNSPLYADESSIPLPAPPSEAEGNRVYMYTAFAWFMLPFLIFS